MERPYRISLLGKLEVHADGRIVRRFRSRKAASLLAYLAYHLRSDHARDVLIELFWPDSDSDCGRQNLRAELSALRRALELGDASGLRLIHANRSTVRLDHSAVQTDVAEMEALFLAARHVTAPVEQLALLQRAIELYQGELLPGHYEDWVSPARDRLADLHRAALRRAASLLRDQGDLEAAIDYARRAAAGSLCEDSHLDLMRIYVDAGRTDDAMRHYREFERLLRAELDCEPSPEIKELASQCASGRVARDAPAAVPRLPVTLTRFFGREREVAGLMDALKHAPDPGRGPNRRSRLITLTGPGGAGKTRLAVEATSGLGQDADAVWFVPLEHVENGGQLPSVLARAMGLPSLRETRPLDQIITVLNRRSSVLVLDTFEHLLESGRGIVEQLLRATPTLICLVTSRRRLGVDGEQEMPVPPLPFPEDSDRLTPDELLSWASVQLFLDRARLHRPDFEIMASNVTSIAAICARLEGHPLSIELAAGWTRTLSPAEIVERLCDRFSLLVARDPAQPTRHSSLGAVMDSSWQLLPASSKQFLARLTVFRGGWDLEAAEAICLEQDALGLLSDLCDRSLVVAEERLVGMRYRLLEMVREYAAAHLTAAERDDITARHADFYVALAEASERGLLSPDNARWVERLKAESANLSAALDYSRRTEAGLRAAAALAVSWPLIGSLAEGEKRLESAISANPAAPLPWRAKAIVARAALALLAGNRVRAESSIQEARGFYEDIEDAALLGEITLPLTNPEMLLYNIGSSHPIPGLEELLQLGRAHPHVQAFLLGLQGEQAVLRGDNAAAEKLFRRCDALYRELGDSRGIAAVTYLHAMAMATRGDYREGRRLREKCLEYYEEIGDLAGIARTLDGLAYASVQLADYERAEELVDRSLTVSRRIGSAGNIASALWIKGGIAFRRGLYDEAAQLFGESVEQHAELGNQPQMADALCALARVASIQGNYARSRELLEECLALRRVGTDRHDVAFALIELASVEIRAGNVDRAEALLQEGLAIAQEAESAAAIAQAQHELSLVALQRGNQEEAVERLRTSAKLRAQMADRKRTAESLVALADAHFQRGELVIAARVFQALEYVAEGMGEAPDLAAKMNEIGSRLNDTAREEARVQVSSAAHGDWMFCVQAALRY